VGLRMRKFLKEKHGFDLLFEDSLRYVRWGDSDDSFKDHAIKRVVGPGEVVCMLPLKSARHPMKDGGPASS